MITIILALCCFILAASFILFITSKNKHSEFNKSDNLDNDCHRVRSNSNFRRVEDVQKN